MAVEDDVSESSISKVVSTGTRFRICLKKRRTEQVESVDDDRVRAQKTIGKRRSAAEEEVAVVDNVPGEIRDDILMRLPTDSLLRCTAVCKPWKDVIRSSEFIRTHLKQGKTNTTKYDDDDDDENGLLLLRSSDPKGRSFDYSLHLYDSPSFSEYSKLANPFEAYKRKIADNPPSSISSHLRQQAIQRGLGDDCWVRVVGTYNGLLCLLHRTTSTTMIANPCIRKLVILPPPNVPRPDEYKYNYPESYAFGYDSRTNDYKVFRSLTEATGHAPPCQIEIWSLSKGYWRSLSADVIPPNFSPGLHTSHYEQQPFLKGAVHWIHYPPLADGIPNFIVSFNMSTELFGKIALPEAALRWHYAPKSKPRSLIDKDAFTISTYAQSLAVFEKHEESESNGIFFISMWRMREYGVAESWQKLFTVRHQGDIPYVFRALGKSGELVLRNGEEQYWSVDIKTQKLNSFQIAGYHCVYDNLGHFVESLVLLDHPSAISY